MTQDGETTLAGNTLFDTKKILNDSSSNYPRSHFATLSSFFSSNSPEDRSRGVFGFRKLAKAYLKGSEKGVRRSPIRNLAEQQLGQEDSTHSGYFKDSIRCQNNCMRNGAEKQMLAELNGSMESFRLKKPNFNGELVDYELDGSGIPRKVPDLFIEECDMGLKEDIIHHTSSSEEELFDDRRFHKSVIFANIPGNIGLGSILSQVCGGPLETISVCRNENDDTLRNVKLDFLKFEAARSFMRYGRTNLFKINGVHLIPEWGVNGERRSKLLSDEMLEEIPEVCRSLIMKKYATNKKIRHCDSSKGPVPDFLDVTEIRRDFEVFGRIQDMAPIVSRKLCISVSFYCIDSAIRAMDDYQNSDSYLHKKYFRGWAVWYGKDITDRPCIEL